MRNDLKLHAMAGAGIAVLVYILMLLLSIDYPAYIVAILAVIVAGIGKELIWDKLLGKGRMQVSDAVATCVAGLLTVFILEIIMMIF